MAFAAVPGSVPGKASGGVADAMKAEKIGWYREVLQLEPGSKIFLPFARLLDELGRTAEAVQALRDGLEKHPEFIEARLFLIDVLHKNGQTALCGAEVARLAGLFREYPGFWEAWSAVEDDGSRKPDLSVSLGFLGAMFRNCDITFVDVLSAGLRALQAQGFTADSLPQNAFVPTQGLEVSPAPSFVPATSLAPDFSPAADGLAPTVSMPGAMVEAAEDPLPDMDVAFSATMTSAPPFVFRGAPPATADSVSAEEKCSLRTRSMAEVLAEQGDTRGAVDIYEELLACCRPEDRPSLEARLEDLLAHLGEQGPVAGPLASGHPTASSQPKKMSVKPRNGVLDLLEKLAVRLENKARQ